MNKARKILYISAAVIILTSLAVPILTNNAAAGVQKYTDIFSDRAIAQAVAEAHQDSLGFFYSGPQLTADSEIYGADLSGIYMLVVTENVHSLEGLQELRWLGILNLLGENNTFTKFPDLYPGQYWYSAEIASHNLSSLENLKLSGPLTISSVPSSLIENYAPSDNAYITGLTLKNTDITSFDFLSNFPGITDLTVENAPDISDFSGLYTFSPMLLGKLELKNVGTNVKNASLNIQDLLTGSIPQIYSLYLDGVRADFSDLTGKDAAEMVSSLSLTNMGLSDFSVIVHFRDLYDLILADNKFTSIEGIENVIEIPMEGWTKYIDVNLSNTELRSSNNTVRDITPLEKISEQGRYKFTAENQYITESPVSYSPSHEMRNVIRTGSLELVCRINAPQGAQYTVEYDSSTDIVSWKNIPADASEISYNFLYYSDGMQNPPSAKAVIAGKGIVFSGTVTIPIRAAQANTFKVMYHENSGSLNSAEVTDIRGPYSEGAAVEVLGNEVTDFKRTGFTFAGWNPDQSKASAGEADPAYSPGKEFIMPARDEHLYAVWQDKNASQPDPPEKSSSPKTGDSSYIWLCISLGAAAVMITARNTGRRAEKS